MQQWGNEAPAAGKPVGFVLSLEGADSLITVQHLERAYNAGLRAVGPAHYGPGRYANGTDATGKLNSEGKSLLQEMERLNMILDATHLCDDAFWQALGLYKGNVWASHHNCRALVNHNRQMSDEMIHALLERKAVIGVALDAWMMVPGWVRGQSTPHAMNCNLDKAVDHIDHICNLAGNALQVASAAISTAHLEESNARTILQTSAICKSFFHYCKKEDYTEEDIENILHRNWLRFLERALPD